MCNAYAYELQAIFSRAVVDNLSASDVKAHICRFTVYMHAWNNSAFRISDEYVYVYANTVSHCQFVYRYIRHTMWINFCGYGL